MKISKPYYRIDKCPKGHKMTGIGMSACDKIYECKCNKWIKYCNGPLIIFKKNGKKKIKHKVTSEMLVVCGYLGCEGKIIKTESERYWSESCNRCGWGTGGSK